MPELPEVESVRENLEARLLGQRLVSAASSTFKLRKDFSAPRLFAEKPKLRALKRHGKRLFLIFPDFYFDVSLGMSGSFRIEKRRKPQKHDHILLSFTDLNLIYNDPRRFGWVTYLKGEGPVALKGWDPLLSSEKEFKLVVKKAAISKKTIYAFLMDQDKVVGLGNIYVQEILFLAGFSPFRKTSSLEEADWLKLKRSIRKILNKALKYGGSTILSYKNAKGEQGGFQKKLKVYGKKASEPCSKCKTPIKFVRGLRAICYCPKCQS